MKNILLPTDFSKNSINAIEYAMRFFKDKTCNFYLLNVQKSSEYISDDLVSGSKEDSVFDSIATDNKKSISQLINRLKNDYKLESYSFFGLFDYDNFVSAVDQVVQFHSIDLIIMGSNGATGVKKKLFGSNTLQIIRSKVCPVITVPACFSYNGIKSVLFSTMKNKNFSSQEIDIFIKTLNMHQPELHVLEVIDDSLDESQKANTVRFKKVFLNKPFTYHTLNNMPGLSTVNVAVQLLKVDIHAVLTENETFLERLLYGSKTSKLVYETSIPLMFLNR